VLNVDREQKLNALSMIMDKREHNKDIEYFKAYIEFYEVYYDIDLREAYDSAAGDLPFDVWNEHIETMVEAYFDLNNR
jgi:hypothetical protein